MNHQTIIKVSGGDALDFLQGQLTNDLHRLDRGASMRCAWCSPKGRVICLFLVSMDEDGYSLLLPAELADNVLKRLTMFRFRAKVEFETEAAADGADLSELIRDGIPHIGSDQSEKFTAHMLNLDLLGAINFEKGCYTGQEIIARTHYKGATKRRALRFESAAPVSVGDKVSDGSRAESCSQLYPSIKPTARSPLMASNSPTSLCHTRSAPTRDLLALNLARRPASLVSGSARFGIHTSLRFTRRLRRPRIVACRTPIL
jgi:folate-binding protein YgfZ